MDKELRKGRRVLVLGMPKGVVEKFSFRAMAEFDSPVLKRHCRGQRYAMFKFEFVPWGQPDTLQRDELKWLVKHGGYKEPSLVRVEPGGRISAVKYIIHKGGISDFLLGESSSTPTRKSIYLGLAIATLLVSLLIMTLARRR
jgi:hypothetical protein